MSNFLGHLAAGLATGAAAFIKTGNPLAALGEGAITALDGGANPLAGLESTLDEARGESGGLLGEVNQLLTFAGTQDGGVRL